MTQPGDIFTDTDDILSALSQAFRDDFLEQELKGHAIGLWCLPLEDMVDVTALKSSKFGVETWMYNSTTITDLLLKLWESMDRAWVCLMLSIRTKSGEFVIEFFTQDELDRDLRRIGDLEGKICQFLAVKNGKYLRQ